MHEVDQSKLQSPWLMKGPRVGCWKPGESVGFVIFTSAVWLILLLFWVRERSRSGAEILFFFFFFIFDF